MLSGKSTTLSSSSGYTPPSNLNHDFRADESGFTPLMTHSVDTDLDGVTDADNKLSVLSGNSAGASLVNEFIWNDAKILRLTPVDQDPASGPQAMCYVTWPDDDSTIVRQINYDTEWWIGFAVRPNSTTWPTGNSWAAIMRLYDDQRDDHTNYPTSNHASSNPPVALEIASPGQLKLVLKYNTTADGAATTYNLGATIPYEENVWNRFVLRLKLSNNTNQNAVCEFWYAQDEDALTKHPDSFTESANNAIGYLFNTAPARAFLELGPLYAVYNSEWVLDFTGVRSSLNASMTAAVIDAMNG